MAKVEGELLEYFWDLGAAPFVLPLSAVQALTIGLTGSVLITEIARLNLVTWLSQVQLEVTGIAANLGHVIPVNKLTLLDLASAYRDYGSGGYVNALVMGVCPRASVSAAVPFEVDELELAAEALTDYRGALLVAVGLTSLAAARLIYHVVYYYFFPRQPLVGGANPEGSVAQLPSNNLDPITFPESDPGVGPDNLMPPGG